MSLQSLALQGTLPETLPEEVLALVASSVSAVARNGDDDALVAVLLHEDLLEPVAEVEEVVAVDQLALQEVGLDVEFIESHSKSFLSLRVPLELRTHPLVSEGVVLLQRVGGSLAHLGLGSQTHDGVRLLIGCSFGLQVDRTGERFSFFTGVDVVDEFGIIIVVLPGLHLGFVDCSVIQVTY